MKRKLLTIEKIEELFEAYKKEVKSNPRIKIEYVGRNGETKNTPIERPLTLSGFETYCSQNASDVHHYMDNTDGRYEEYRTIITRIKKEIRAEQVDGALTGFYNPNLTARLNSITEKQEVKQTTIQPLFGKESNN